MSLFHGEGGGYCTSLLKFNIGGIGLCSRTFASDFRRGHEHNNVCGGRQLRCLNSTILRLTVDAILCRGCGSGSRKFLSSVETTLIHHSALGCVKRQVNLPHFSGSLPNSACIGTCNGVFRTLVKTICVSHNFRCTVRFIESMCAGQIGVSGVLHRGIGCGSVLLRIYRGCELRLRCGLVRRRELSGGLVGFRSRIFISKGSVNCKINGDGETSRRTTTHCTVGTIGGVFTRWVC